jgi:hypothetical protein
MSDKKHGFENSRKMSFLGGVEFPAGTPKWHFT